MIAYFRLEKARMDRQRIAEATKGVGKPKIGGQFELVDQEGRKFTDEDLKGGYSLVCAPTASSMMPGGRTGHIPRMRSKEEKIY